MTNILYIVDATTQEVIERPMTPQELAIEKQEREMREAAEASLIAEEKAKAKAKDELLAKLGITADEAALLLG